MADFSNPIYYRQMIVPDNSIDDLISKLTEVIKLYGDTQELIKKNASEVQSTVRNTSGAVEQSREVIKNAANDAARLERAQRELAFATSETGARVQELKVLTQQANKQQQDAAKFIHASANSYKAMESELKLAVDNLKNLSKEEALNSAEGAKLINRILTLKDGMREYDNMLKLVTSSSVRYTKESQNANSADSARNTILAQVAMAEQRLAFARSKENEQLKLYSTQIREANEIAKLTAVINNSAEGSYDRLSAQYALNKIKLNAMSKEERAAAESGRLLEDQTREIYAEMIRLQEATGNHRLSVGNYKRAWDGLGVAVSQVVRELPAAAVSLNTFFLGISNNIPILADEIARLRRENEAFIAKGEPTKSVIGSIAKALFGWNTILVIVLTTLSMYGKQIADYVKNLFTGVKATKSALEITEDLNEELAKNTSNYGKHVVSVKKLSDEYRALGGDLKKQKEWIKENESAFKDLDISIRDVNDANNAFIENTPAVLEALKLRAKATAANSLAVKKYEEAFVKTEEAKLMELKKPSLGQSVLGALVFDPAYAPGSLAGKLDKSRSETVQAIQIQGLKDEAKAAEDLAESLYDLSSAYDEQSKAMLKAAGLGEYKKQPKQPKERKKRDMSEYIDRVQTEVQKKYAQSITNMTRNEFDKQRSAAIDTYNAESAALLDKYSKNKRILEDEGKEYKKLTNEQREQVEQTQKDIIRTVEQYQKELNQKLEDIERDRQINELEILQQTIDLRLDAVKKGSEEELKYRLAAIEAERKAAILKNAKLPKPMQQSETDINAAFDKQAATTVTSFSQTDFAQQQALEDATFNIIKRSEYAKTKFKLQQEKERQERLIALAESGAIDMSKKEIDTMKMSVKGIDRQMADLDMGASLLERLGFDDKQIDALSEAANIVVEQLGAILDAEVQMAEQAVEAANKRVEAAQRAYEAEVEARANGYANNVATTKKELENEKKQQREKEKMLAEAQRRKEALDSITQASSLITASANIWSSLSGIPIVGPALAIAAIGTMWTSFAVAKVKAKQVTAKSDEYGEGGLEFLEGGSHASGNDIDLGVKNKRKRNMKAEGGEALAIINKKQTARYKKLLPDVINSLNKGTFEDKYLNAFSGSDGVILMQNQSNIDMTKLENEVAEIRKQGETKYFYGPNGQVIEIRKNVKRVIVE
ncbi:hypothetical protein BF486P3_00060 [Bacteroides phage BF486P3]|nr:hypothetical protein BF486P2_00060 [Bacteroides phage BF486P2]WAX06885.1 hypothetical protein BF486P3_00060 [Bacteroides phage BF486P3]WAX06888.1 hypothetical protein BF494P1_00002 [Bacteroides phage BF494P1]